jgi:hypothetical protein
VKGGAMKSFFARRLRMCMFFILITCSNFAFGSANWTILIYAQANNSLCNFAFKNFNDIATIGSNKNLNILVQWYNPGKPGIWRYKIDKGKIILDEQIASQTDGNNPQDIVDAMGWAVSKYPAQKYALVLWNHGIGILDPEWGNSMNIINGKSSKNNPKIQIAGITTGPTKISSKTNSNQSGIFPLKSEECVTSRGILFNERSRTYLTNQQLLQALSRIKTDVLKNKKIDILGMDACLMAMIEVGYQVKDFARYIVGSQEVELAYGWNYAGFLPVFASDINMDTSVAAQSIVQAYESLYKKKINFYTQSAVDLEKIETIKQCIDVIVASYENCKMADNRKLVDVLRKSRNNCLQFSSPSYIDLHSFCNEFYKQLHLAYEKKFSHDKSQQFSENLEILKKSLINCMRLIEGSVVANASGKYLSKAKGLSIYFPQNNVDLSYPKTEFAKDSSWLSFLRNLIYG